MCLRKVVIDWQNLKLNTLKNKMDQFPYEEFLLSQDVKMRAKIYRLLILLEEFGNTLREPYSKSLERWNF